METWKQDTFTYLSCPRDKMWFSCAQTGIHSMPSSRFLSNKISTHYILLNSHSKTFLRATLGLITEYCSHVFFYNYLNSFLEQSITKSWIFNSLSPPVLQSCSTCILCCTRVLYRRFIMYCTRVPHCICVLHCTRVLYSDQSLYWVVFFFRQINIFLFNNRLNFFANKMLFSYV